MYTNYKIGKRVKIDEGSNRQELTEIGRDLKTGFLIENQDNPYDKWGESPDGTQLAIMD